MSTLRPADRPRWVVLQLVEACNLRCRMCYEWGDGGSLRREDAAAQLDYELVRRVVADCAPGLPCFELFGGEPFLYPRIGDVIRLIGDTGCVLGIPTNGTLVTQHLETLVGDQPIRLWISLDGPEEVNDRQRGKGVFRRALGGLEAVYAARETRGRPSPLLGVTYIVTPLTAGHVARCFLESLDLSHLDFVSIVLQNFATAAECDAYEQLVVRELGGASARHARGYVRDVRDFAAIDCVDLARQIDEVRDACRAAGVAYFSNPMTTDAGNLGHYFAARWGQLADRRSRCAFPWMYAEVTARGDVATCHSFYDVTVGSLHQRGLLDIWRGREIERVRRFLRSGLFPICTACCRYYNNPTAAVLAGLHEPRAAAFFGSSTSAPPAATDSMGDG